MSDKPLLIFPLPTYVQRVKLQSASPKPFKVKPTRQQQGARLSPKFSTLENFITSERGILRSDATGLEPEMVLVFETRGPIDKFINAVKKMPEFEWLAEFDETFESDDIYVGEKDAINGKLFMIMSNYRALTELKSLWDNYYLQNKKFERGLAKWGNLFDLLYDVRLWNSQDRLQETGIIEDLTYSLNQLQSEIVTFEIELWFRYDQTLRQRARNKIQSFLGQNNGQILNECIISGIQYHALLLSAPSALFSDLQNLDDVELFKYQEIMYVRPRGQCIIPDSQNETTDVLADPNHGFPTHNPIIGLLDGMPLQNHSLLVNRLIIDDPDDFQNDYLADGRNHATHMASLIIYGDLQGDRTPIRSRLYVRPIMKLYNRLQTSSEEIPENTLIVDLIHRAVVQIFNTNPTIKVINLSIGDSSRVFDNQLSPLSKLLDWLSFEYNLLFIVSAGNCYENFTVANFEQFANDPQRLEQEVLSNMYSTLRRRKIISPAESINSVTVGAAHADLSQIPGNYPHINFHTNNRIHSPVSRLGFGFKRSIKPDILVPGGRVTYLRPVIGNDLKLSSFAVPPGQLTASPKNQAGIHSRGTSNSAALTSRAVAKLHEGIVADNLLPEETLNSFFPVISKALIVHSSSWDNDASQLIENTIKDRHQFIGNEKELISRFLGYGNADFSRIIECTDKRITLLGIGALQNEEAHLYKLPIPTELAGKFFTRSLTATLSWLTPINPSSQLYRKAKLWYDFPSKTHNALLQVKRKYYDHNAVTRGTVQHEIFEGDRPAVIVDGSELEIRVNCKEDSMKLKEQVKYCLAVTLEIANIVDVDIYERIKQRLAERIGT